MLALLPLFAFLALWLLLGNLRPNWGWRRSFLRAAVLAGSYAILVTEALSLVRGVSKLWLAVAWAIPLLAMTSFIAHHRAKRSGVTLPQLWWPSDWIDRALLICVVGIAVTTGVVAWFSPPNTWDSLTYHMSRVAHWAQQHSLSPFATGIERQNFMPPGAEIFMLHLYVLASGDQLVCLVEWSAMLISLVGVSLIAHQLGAKPTGQLLAGVFAATLPMGIAQASSTMTDYVVGLWVLCLAGEALAAVDETRLSLPVLFGGLAGGLSIVTKPTAYPFVAPLGLLMAWAVIRRAGIRKAASLGAAALVLAITLNLGPFYRNATVYGNPLGRGETVSDHAGLLWDWRAWVSGVLRNASLHAGTPFPEVNSLINRAIMRLHFMMGLEVTDPRTSVRSSFGVREPKTSETRAGNPVQAVLTLTSYGLLALKRHRVRSWVLGYAIVASASFILLSVIFKFSPFGSRYHLPFFLLVAPIFGLAFESLASVWAGRALGLAMIVAAWPWLVGIDTRPLIPKPGTSLSVIAEQRENLYFGTRGAQVYREVAGMIQDAGCSSVAIMLGGDSPEYPLWFFLGAPASSVRIEWIVAGTPSARYRDPAFDECAVICDETCPADWTIINGLPLVMERTGMRLFLQTRTP